jgi:LuxR family transcriptional regulator, maltose regulon positive regulatory protein
VVVVASSQILQTKLTPPRLKDDILRRPTLTKKLKNLFQVPFTLVHSGPGYGKSTEISTFLTDTKKKFCWYSISRYDDEVIPFLLYFIYSIKSQYPTFGDQQIEYLTQMNRYVRDDEIRSFSAMLVNEIIELDEEIILVMDDFHFIEHSQSIEDWMFWFLENMPSNLRFVLLSRNRPQWSVITTLKLKGKLLEIKEPDLSFTSEDIEAWLTDVYRLDLHQAEINQIYQVTEGWIIALQMIIQQLNNETDIVKLLENKGSSVEELFNFLATEVLTKQPPMVQRFLEQTCIFDELTAPLCDSVLGISGSKDMLELLIQKNLFLQSVGNGQYRYHALFKEFLERQIAEQTHQFKQLHRRAADYFQKRNQLELSIYHLEQLEEHEEIAYLLNEYGSQLIHNGKLETLLDYIKKVPLDLKQQFYMLNYYQGEILRYQCLYKESEEYYQKAAMYASQAGDLLNECRALEGQAFIYLDTIQPGKADRLLQRAIQLTERIESASPEESARLYRLMAENLVNAGQAKKAGKWFEKTIEAGNAEDIGNLEARLKLRTGLLYDARRILMQKKNLEMNAASVHLQQSHRETNLLYSLIESFVGEAEHAKELAETGIQEGILYKAPFVEAVGWIRMGHAVQLISRYDTALAQKCYFTALEMMEELNVSRGKAEPLMGLCVLYGIEGVFEKAIEYGKQALQETELVNDAWLSSYIQLCMGIMSIYAEKYDEAFQWLEKTYDHFHFCGDQYGITLTHLWRSILFFQLEKWPQFRDAFTNFINDIQVGGYEFLLKKRTTFGPRDLQMMTPLMIEAQAQGIQRQYVASLLNDLGFHDVESHPGYTLRVQTLGRFRVWIGDREVREKDWQRGKARELFEFFITKHHQFSQRDTIFAHLWREVEEKAATRDFKVAFNALNNAIEPNRKARSNPFFFQRDGQSYGLNPKASIYLDAEEFERWMRSGLKEKDTEKAISLLTKGLELYDGDYLPERRFEDWCVAERERLLVYYLRGAEKIAQLSLQLKNYDESIHWCENILSKDETWEEAYRILMYCFYQKNNRPQAIKWYKKCCERLEKELGVSPMEPTKQMYEMITRPH